MINIVDGLVEVVEYPEIELYNFEGSLLSTIEYLERLVDESSCEDKNKVVLMLNENGHIEEMGSFRLVHYREPTQSDLSVIASEEEKEYQLLLNTYRDIRSKIKDEDLKELEEGWK